MITTSPDGQWAVVRRGREVSLLASAAGPATSRLELPTEDADLVIVGPPSVLAIVTREPAEDGGPAKGLVLLHQPPYLDPVAQLELDVPMRLAAVTGSRLVLVSLDGKAATIVRVAGRALSAQSLVPGSPIEFAVGLERNQVLFGLWRKLEAWDAVSCRPQLRMQLQLPPPPRLVGPAHGHLWAARLGGEDVVLYRLSDGRPFQHTVGAPIDEVVSHPASPLLILVTARGLVRLHCFAHSLTAIDAPWQPGMALAQLVIGDDISLLGIADDRDEPWRVPIGGAGAPGIVPEVAVAPIEPASAVDKLRAMRERSGESAAVASPPAAPAAPEPQGLGGIRSIGLRARISEPAESAPPPAALEPASIGASRGITGITAITGISALRSRADEPDIDEPRAAPEPPIGGAIRGISGLRARAAELADPGEPSDGPDPATLARLHGRGIRARSAEAAPEEPASRPPARIDLGSLRARTAEHAARDRSAPIDLGGSAVPAEPRDHGRGDESADPASRDHDWREPLARFAVALVRGNPGDIPEVAAETELGQLAQRIGLRAEARRALIALYGVYLVGEPAVSIAGLAGALGAWSEPLGRGELAALAMLRRRGGRVALRAPVTDLLDGAAPGAIRVIGSAAAPQRPGAVQHPRDGKSDAMIEAELVAQLDRIAVIDGPAARAVLEAWLHGATAVAFAAPRCRPAPWPRDASLVVIAAPDAPAWVTALPALATDA